MEEKLLRKISLITGSSLRGAIVRALKREPTNYSTLRKALGDDTGKEITDGRLAWHIKVLEVDDIIKEETRSGETTYFLTASGSAAYEAMSRAYDVMSKAENHFHGRLGNNKRSPQRPERIGF